MAVRRQWFLDGGGFDESYVNGFEDVDLCMRAREAGRTIRYVADSRFAHYEGASEGRYDREVQNERRFYERWSPAFRTMPRVARGEVGAITVRAAHGTSSFASMALEDLETALGSFGHPVVRGGIRVWQRADRRFRRSAALGWFEEPPETPSVTLEARSGSLAELNVRGHAELRVPWLPCASPGRAKSLPIRASLDPNCKRVVEVDVTLKAWPVGDVACAVVHGQTDLAAFGNVVLAQAGIPVVLASETLRSMYAADCVAVSVEQLVESVEARERYGRALAADAARRFSPRRTAIRVVDLLCAARFGLERPAPAETDSPIRL
jgi:hypothetical protein